MRYLLALLVLALALPCAALRVRVEGTGYLTFLRDARAVFAREADLVVRDGALAHAAGPEVLPRIAVGAGALRIEPDGRVFAGASLAGRLRVTVFPAGTEPQVSGPFVAFSVRGRSVLAGEDGAGTIVSGAAAPTVPLGRIVVQVRAESETASDAFTIGDIADVQGDGPLAESLRRVVAGDTPAFGVARGLERGHLLARLRRAGIDESSLTLVVPAGAVVRRASQVVSHTDLVAAGRAHLASRLGETTLEAEPARTETRVPPGAIELVPESESVEGSSAIVNVAVVVDGRRVLARTIRFKTGGTTLSVRVGQMVKVRVQSNAAVVETTGRIRRGGSIGQAVEVETDQGARLSGVLVQPGLVEVTL